ncbi:hypothetical protein Ae201684_013796 [Aphanomyces euteiches]|uniref:Uncharacterized protein n=1 Tax=Aphanomyces euteiches TaxID=100861 RepID=A0A6G0WM78_9STRA|nr:hypothetical protein Ae201684_013796 [Aphanomyces euteiches]
MVWCPREDQVKSPSGSKKYGGPSGTQALDRPSCLMTARHGHAELKPPRSKNTSVVAVRVQCLLFFAFAKQMLAYFGFLAQFEPISNTSTLSIGYLFVFLWRHIDYLAFFDPIFVQARRGGFALYISTEQREGNIFLHRITKPPKLPPCCQINTGEIKPSWSWGRRQDHWSWRLRFEKKQREGSPGGKTESWFQVFLWLYCQRTPLFPPKQTLFRQK